jgi:uncharacterized repeat protein (TIGR02543 family)
MGITTTATYQKSLMSHELGHLWGLDDLYHHNTSLQSIYSSIPNNPTPTRHDRNALRIGLNDPHFEDGNGNWKYLKPTGRGQFVTNQWVNNSVLGMGYRFFNSSGNWVPNATFQISFDSHGGTTHSNTSTGEGGKLSLPAPSRTGYTFKGWFTTATGGTQITPNTQFTTNATIHAQWSAKTYNVILNKNDGLGTTSTITTTYDSNSITNGSSGWSSPTINDDYIFDGYWTATSGGYRVINTSGQLEANVPGYTNSSRQWIRDNTSTTLIARWNYRITYNANNNGAGGTVPGKGVKIHREDYTLTNSIPSNPPNSYFTINYNANGGTVSETSKNSQRYFKNWTTQPNGSGTSYQKGGIYTANDPVTLYAQWRHRPGAMPRPIRSGYVFNGWFTTTTGGTRITSSSEIPANNYNVYAQWGVEGIHHIRNAHNNRYLQSPTTNNATVTLTQSRQDVKTQRWVLQKVSGYTNDYELRSAQELSGTNHIGAINYSNGTATIRGTSGSADYSRSVEVKRNTDDGTVTFLWGSNLALATNANGTQAVWTSYNGSPTPEQRWHLEVHENTYKRGDINLDGQVTVTDKLQFQKYMSGQSSDIKGGERYYLADFNKDGEIANTDLLELLKYLSDTQSSVFDCASYDYNNHGYIQSTQIIADGWYHIKTHGGYYVHVENNIPEADQRLVLYNTVGGDNTKYYFEHIGNGEYYIKSYIGSRLYADLFGPSYENDASIGIYNFNGNNNQIWKPNKYGNHYIFVNKFSNKALDVFWNINENNKPLSQYTPSYSEGQLFSLIPVN